MLFVVRLKLTPGIVSAAAYDPEVGAVNTKVPLA